MAQRAEAELRAIAHDLPLYTCNPEDFAAIDELTVRSVPHPDHH
jgi:tRNA(fMet)-specific endonuclease VapC